MREFLGLRRSCRPLRSEIRLLKVKESVENSYKAKLSSDKKDVHIRIEKLMVDLKDGRMNNVLSCDLASKRPKPRFCACTLTWICSNCTISRK